METEKMWNDKILEITMDIQQNHPELSKFLGEMPVTIPNEDKPEINVQVLKEYYESLNKMLQQYLFEQNSKDHTIQLNSFN